MDDINENDMNTRFQSKEELNKLIYLDNDVIKIDVIPDYGITLDRCNSKEKILDWVLHLSEKSWMNRDLINRFIQVAYSAHGLKRNPV